MDPLRLNDVVARVVAWHNRHPLALRIEAAQVHSIGEVVLPFRARAVRGSGAGLRLFAAFSEDFIWPLRPAAVARWAKRHGEHAPVAPEDWPQRQVATDGLLAHRLEARGLAMAVDLHLLTAAIGVGDRRIRLLLDGRGTVLGPRAYHRNRLLGLGAAAVALAAAAALSTGWLSLPSGLGLPGAAGEMSSAAHGPDPTASAAQAGLTPEPAASSATNATESLAPTTTHTAHTTTHATPADAAASGGTLLDDASASAPNAGTSVASSHATPHAGADTPAQVAQASIQAAPGAADPATPVPAVAPAPAPAPAPAHTQARPKVKLGQVRPRLADDERQTALAAGQRLRGEAAQPATAQAITAANTARIGPVYALVTAPTHQQGLAQAQLAKTQILGRIDATLVPPHAELIAAKGQWRAALWPFASLADADRARVVLAGKGLKAQVVEF